MAFETESRPAAEVAADWLVLGVLEDADPAGPAAALDAALEGRLGRLREWGDLTGKHAELLALRDPPGIASRRLLLVGLGKREELDLPRFERAMLTALRHLTDKAGVRAAVVLPPENSGEPLPGPAAARLVATAATVAGVGQGRFQREPSRFPFQEVIVVADPAAPRPSLEEAVEEGRLVGEAINLTRDLVDRPAEEIYPESFAERAAGVASELGLACEVLDEPGIARERMGALLAVARGSDRPPRVVAIDYRGAGPNAPVLALVGKGVTFDSGGLSMKSTDNMLAMKCDMAGAATVLGAVAAIARLRLPVNVSGYMGLVENMVSGRSYKLGDVLTARSGVTIEVHNTDAEGRLVLADVLAWAVDRGCDRLVDLATLTGACVVALGEDVTGAFSNDPAWCDRVLEAARRAGEDVWPLPMFAHYDELLKSDVADCKNVGGRWGGAITAAKFLEKFVGAKPWVHLDIAGPSFASGSKPHREGGATGVMVRTLVELARRGNVS